MSSMNLEKVYDWVNNEVLWGVLRMFGVGGKLLNVYVVMKKRNNEDESKIS